MSTFSNRTGRPFTIGMVVAAGSGSRLGAAIPKAFLPVAGITMVQRAIDLLFASELIDLVVVVVPSDFDPPFKFVSSAVDDSESAKSVERIITVKGGSTRQISVKNGLTKIVSALERGDFKPFIQDERSAELSRIVIAIHDAARCFTPSQVVIRVLEKTFTHNAVTAALPAVDTLKTTDKDGIIRGDIDRSSVWQIQTPQAFRLDLLWQAHNQEYNEATDDTSLVSKVYPVSVVEGSRFSFKITTMDDLEFASRILLD